MKNATTFSSPKTSFALMGVDFSSFPPLFSDHTTTFLTNTREVSIQKSGKGNPHHIFSFHLSLKKEYGEKGEGNRGVCVCTIKNREEEAEIEKFGRFSLICRQMDLSVSPQKRIFFLLKLHHFGEIEKMIKGHFGQISTGV